ncbi:hypothetical protein J14TS2_17370 [Bacillus sp. J14TS2]|uniref:hypothetical protein n=1 Tax=Bacillus sp. J14TS2 TaxID=2807188 RepID=UPI001B136CE1|nr:hypothetical protein [Bacillus sp. J14TS2]GIN71262.1 hypothetical protein J14TS2_17370 [Bacillus sp. J14TS2]
MSKYKVNILLKDGQKIEFVTKTNLNKARRQVVMGDEYLVTEDLYIISFKDTRKIKVEEIGK